MVLWINAYTEDKQQVAASTGQVIADYRAVGGLNESSGSDSSVPSRDLQASPITGRSTPISNSSKRAHKSQTSAGLDELKFHWYMLEEA